MKVSRLQNLLGGVYSVARPLFYEMAQVESSLLKKELSSGVTQPVFVCGLARSGTTFLLECLSEHPEFITYQYRDYPFPMLPKWWGDFVSTFQNRKQIPQERIHGDGLQVTPQSPEAMEEMIWMHFFPHLHTENEKEYLGAETTHPEFEKFYSQTIEKLLVSRGGTRYLAKNNYNLTRIPYLKKIFPDAAFIVPVRDPVEHVVSLMRQHQMFCDKQTQDSRILKYMERAGHFEFGLNRRFIVTREGAADELQSLCSEGKEAEALARYWNDLHGVVLNELKTNPDLRNSVWVVGYDKFCQEPLRGFCSLGEKLGLQGDAEALYSGHVLRVKPPGNRKGELKSEESNLVRAVTDQTYQELLGFSL